MKNCTYLLLALICVGASAHAQDPAIAPQAAAVESSQQPATVPTPVSMSAQQMVEAGPGSFLTDSEKEFAKQEEELLRQIRLAQMQLELIEIQKKMREDTARPVDSVNVALPDSPVIDAPQRDPFHLVGVWGDETGLQADLLVNGLRVTVRSGSTLPDGWRVARVTEEGVDIAKGGARRTLMIGRFQ